MCLFFLLRCARELTELIAREARSILDDQTDIDKSFHRTADEPTQKQTEKAAARKAQAAAKKTADGDDIIITLTTPNDVSCWYDTNGLRCANKLKINGVCKFSHLHGTCGMPLASGGYCLEKHKAADHK